VVEGRVDGELPNERAEGSGREAEMSAEVKGPQELQREVADRKLCARCGACLGMCPYRATHECRIVVLDECNLSQGRCYAFCPRASVDLDELSQTVFGVPYAGDELGVHQEIVMARAGAGATRARAQHGGTVSALVSFALRQGLIDSAVLTYSDERQQPRGIAVHDEAGVLNCAGSNFVASPTLEAFNREADTDAQRIGVVATPCQTVALAKMRASPLENRNHIEKLKLVVGLFCTWALRYRDFVEFLEEKTQLADITRVDIPPPPAEVFEVYDDSSCVPIPLAEVRRFIRASCGLCIDLTAELADVSVGSAEGADGWNTLIIRSEAGRELSEAAVAAGAIETAPLPEEKLEHLKDAALQKKKRALRNIVDRTGGTEDLLYLKMSGEILERLLA
jgi:coenzyme F420 hydrogenase subunit beta